MATSFCKTCNGPKPIADFEITPSGNPRTECKDCRAAKRRAAAKSIAAKRTTETVPKPERCITCNKGGDEVEFTWRTDTVTGSWRTECDACTTARATKNSAAARASQLAADPDGYRRRMADAHLDWSYRNRDKVKEQMAKTGAIPDRKFKKLMSYAAQKGIVIELADRGALMAKFSEACTYCAFTPAEGDQLNNLDRVDTEGPFSTANTIPCCATCSVMKGFFHDDEFIANIRRIISHDTSLDFGTASTSSVATHPPVSEIQEDLLTEAEKIELWASPCGICGRAPALGIDVNGPCCPDCSFMKRDMPLGEFMRHIARINDHTRFMVLNDITDLTLKAFGTRVREPVAILDDTLAPVLVFPSMDACARMIGTSSQAVLKAVKTGGFCRKRKWVRATPRMYRTQVGDAEQVKTLLRALRTQS